MLDPRATTRNSSYATGKARVLSNHALFLDDKRNSHQDFLDIRNTQEFPNYSITGSHVYNQTESLG